MLTISDNTFNLQCVGFSCIWPLTKYPLPDPPLLSVYEKLYLKYDKPSLEPEFGLSFLGYCRTWWCYMAEGRGAVPDVNIKGSF